MKNMEKATATKLFCQVIGFPFNSVMFALIWTEKDKNRSVVFWGSKIWPLFAAQYYPKVPPLLSATKTLFKEGSKNTNHVRTAPRAISLAC